LNFALRVTLRRLATELASLRPKDSRTVQAFGRMFALDSPSSTALIARSSSLIDVATMINALARSSAAQMRAQARAAQKKMRSASA